ncbi:hypothetical protein [Parafilimonas sp.]|uniref:hypothetical protein n=1 Tax=Parafilimonas sp. TaxID=1969739 RepID=UPI0039E2F210
MANKIYKVLFENGTHSKTELLTSVEPTDVYFTGPVFVSHDSIANIYFFVEATDEDDAKIKATKKLDGL